MTPQHSAGAGPLTAQDVHRWRSEWDRLEGDPIGWFEYIAAQVNARLAAAPTGQAERNKCPQCGGIASLPNRDRFDVFCNNPFHAAPAQDLARLEARLEIATQLYRMCIARGGAANGSLTWPEIRAVTGNILELDSELTLLRAQQAKETKERKPNG